MCYENSTTIGLDIKEKPLYITCCDLDGTGLKDIITADEHNITIFKQNPNLSFKTYTIRSEDEITALNPCKINRFKKEVILCLGINKLFYYLLNSEGRIEGPTYISLPKDIPTFIEKQRNIKNYSFVLDLNNDELDDIILPSEKGPLIFWQIKPGAFRPALMPIEDSITDTTLNIHPWPKVGESAKDPSKGLSFFYTYAKKQNYWFQDYNKDGLLDIISLTEYPDNCVITVFLQTLDNKFQKSKSIKLQNNQHTKRDYDELRLIDLNNDGFMDIAESKLEYPLKGNNSFLPLVITKIYLGDGTFKFDSTPQNLFKSVFLPGLDNIIDIDGDGYCEIISASSQLKLGSKESIIKIVSNKEMTFRLGYFHTDKNQKSYNEYIELYKNFSLILPSLNEIDNFKQFITFDGVDGDGICDILLLKKPSLLEIDLLKKRNNRLYIKQSMDIQLPCPVSYIEAVDINSDGKKELLMLGPSGKKIYIIYWKSL